MISLKMCLNDGNNYVSDLRRKETALLRKKVKVVEQSKYIYRCEKVIFPFVLKIYGLYVQKENF